MYKVIVVDDEPQVRNGIFFGVDWKEFGFEAVAQAADGIEALQQIELNKPHVVFTDICMDKMDGMQLIDIIKGKYPEIEIVLVSGYSDIEYYQKALELKIFSYILKPTNIEDFNKTLKKLKTVLDDATEKEENLSISAEMKKQKLFSSLLCGQTLNRPTIEIINNNYLKNMQCEKFVVCTFILQNGMKLWKFSQKTDYLKKLFFKSIETVMLEGLHDDVVCILPDVSETMDIIKNTGETIENCYVGVSEAFSNIEFLSVYYKQALTAVNQMIFNADKNIFFFEKLFNNNEYVEMSDFKYDKVVQKLFAEDNEFWEEEITRVFESFENKIIFEYDYINVICNNLYYRVIRQGRQQGLEFHEVESFYDNIEKILNLNEKKKMLINTLLSISYMVKDKNSGKLADIIEKINAIIEIDYANNQLCLAYIGEKLSRNTSYLSNIYKQTAGINLSDKIANTRIEHAKQMLRNTNEKSYIIAEKVGFNDCSYFTKIFKKIAGVSPNQYRRNNSNEL